MNSNILSRLFQGTRRQPRPSTRTREALRRRIVLESLEERRLLTADLIHFVTTEHVDINIGHNGTDWSIGPRDSDTPIQYVNDEVVMYVGAPSLTTRPAGAAFDFIGVEAGQDFYLLPQTQSPDLLYAGFAGYGVNASSLDRYNAATESKGRVSGNARWIKASLIDVRHTLPDGTPSNGHVSIWQSGTFGSPSVFIASYDDGVSNPNANGLDTTDGISADDAIFMIAGGHAHYNFGFTQPGRYEVDLRASGYFGDDGLTTPNQSGFSQSEDITLYFSVMSVGQLQIAESSYSVDESAGTISIDVIRVGGSDGRLTVDFETTNGTALAGVDYTAQTGTLEFLDGEIVKTITIPILDDDIEEEDETFEIVLTVAGPTNLDDYIREVEGEANGLLGTVTTATITILDDDGNLPPVANADAHTVDPGNALRGNILLNDVDPEGDPLLAVLVSGPTKGALVLDGNGTFTYTPDPTFNGADSFTYRASDGALESEITTVTINLTGDQRFAAALTEDHVDIGLAYEDGGWDLHIHDEHSDQEYEPYDAVLHVGAAAITTRIGDAANSAFDFLGVAVGETFYLLPQAEDPELIYLGIATEEIADGTFLGDQVELYLKALNGPGHFSMWTGTDTGPNLVMATADGITETDRLLIATGTHAHFSYAFSDRGSYDITFEAVATLPDGTVTRSGDITYRFVVNTASTAVDDAFEATEDTTLTVDAGNGLLANDIDPDGDSLRAALVQGPANGRVTVNPDGSFVYVPNPDFFGTDTFTYTTTDVRYRVVPLGTLGGNSSFALDVNNERQVSGNSNNSAVTGNPLQAYLWQNGSFTPLGVLAGTGSNNFSRGYAVNDAGVVVGESDNNASMAFVYQDGTLAGLTRLAGDNFRGVAHDVNSSNVIVGISSNGTVSRPTIWTFDGSSYVAADLGTISGTETSTGRAWAINDEGLVVGLSHNASGVSQATLWNAGTITNLTSLGNGTRFSQAYGLNGTGLIVGASSTGQTVGELIGSTSTTGITRGFVWENGENVELLPHNFFAPGNTGSSTNYHSVATDVNDAGLIVGNSQRIAGLSAIATLWVNGATMDLNALVDADSGWTLRSAEGINGGGDIVGFGAFDGFSRAFMLVPDVMSTSGNPFSNTATVTITVAGTPDAPVANDDFYVALPGNAVHGNVLFNDYEPDGDPMTASIATGPEHGTVSLSPNGSFVYTPGPTFEGADSFTYTVSDGLGGTDTATVTIMAALVPSFDATLTTGHADIGVAYGEHGDGHGHSHGSEEEWDLHIHDEETDTEYEPGEALLFVGREAVVTREGDAADAAYDFLGVPVGSQLFVLPEVENPALLYLGISGEELAAGLLAGDIAKLQLTSVSGPGEFSMWQAGLTPSTPNLIMATADGIDFSDTFNVVAGSHAHVNYGFTAKGFYEVTFIASGIDSEGHETNSGPVTYYFYVTDQQGAVDDAFAMVGQETLRGSVMLNDEWDEAFGEPTTSIETTTNHGSLILEANGSFTYEPDASFAGSDSFTYRLNNPRGGFTTATVTITQSSAPAFVSLLSEGHADIGVKYEDGAWDLHIHDEETDTEYEPDEALLFVGREAVVTREGDAADAAYDFLGVPVGSQLFVLPEVENTALLYLGIGGEELAPGLLVGDIATLQLASVSGPGEFSMWQAGLTPSTPNMIMATSDGIDSTDTFDVAAGSHSHVNYGFTEPGFYEVTFIASGIDSEGNATNSGLVTYYFYVTDQLGAVDDAFAMVGQEALRGSVMLNDEWDGAAGTPTTSIETTTSHGSLTLESNGSFTYVPGATFAGSDSFTYRLNDPSGGFTMAMVNITQVAAPTLVATLSQGHADIGINYEDGAWDLHIHDEESEAEYAPNEALLYVGPEGLTQRIGDAALPVYDFLGVSPGESFFLLPEIENPDLLFLGIGAEELVGGIFASDEVRLQLYSVTGPGEFAVWQAGLTPETPMLHMATADGIDATDFMTLLAGGHEHVNFAFTKEGVYEVSFVASGLAADGTVLTSDPATYYFRVGRVAPVLSEARVYSTTWDANFIDSIDGDGIGAGNGVGLALADGLAPLPWRGVNRIQLQFSESVQGLSASTVELRDSNGPLPISVQYDPASFVATIEIGANVDFSKLRLSLSDAISDALGMPLDGDEDGVAGGIYSVRFDILAADANGDGRVNGSDLANFAAAFNAQVGQSSFDPRADWNGDARVNGADLSVFAANFNRVLGTLADPGMPFGGGQGGSGQGVGSGRFFDDYFARFGEEDDEEERNKFELGEF